MPSWGIRIILLPFSLFPLFCTPLTKKDAQDNIMPLDNDVADMAMDNLDPTVVRVKHKWTGTHDDRLDMKTLGRDQVLRVRR